MSLGPTQSLKLMEKLNQKRKCSVCTTCFTPSLELTI